MTWVYTLSDYKRNEKIMRELKIPQVTEFTEEERNWKKLVDRINSDRIPKEILKH